jgi:hypothetical protein
LLLSLGSLKALKEKQQTCCCFVLVLVLVIDEHGSIDGRYDIAYPVLDFFSSHDACMVVLA